MELRARGRGTKDNGEGVEALGVTELGAKWFGRCGIRCHGTTQKMGMGDTGVRSRVVRKTMGWGLRGYGSRN